MSSQDIVLMYVFLLSVCVCMCACTYLWDASKLLTEVREDGFLVRLHIVVELSLYLSCACVQQHCGKLN